MSERYDREYHGEVVDSAVDWQSIYCSLIMIMIVFFILLIANSKQDQKEMMTARKSLEEKSSLKDTDRSSRAESGKTTQERSSVLIGAASEALHQVIVSRGLTESASLTTNQRGLRLRMAAPLLFSTGQADLRSDSYSLLLEVARLANQHQLGVMVEGHTDENTMQTTLYPSNWELSMARAAQVRQYLIQSGVTGQHVDAAGFSSYQPVADGDHAVNAKNRRVDIYLSARLDESR